MEDRELLELAAKAAGLDAWWSEPFGFMLLRSDGNRKWSPIENDGDALRLAVKLCMLQSHTTAHGRFAMFYELHLDHGMKPTDATRRAIVRAAAEIGKQMP